MLDQALLFIASFIANLMSALAGGGSGLVQLPALLWFGLPFPIALATHKVATVFLGLGSITRLLGDIKLLDITLGLTILTCGVLGTIAGAYLILHIPDKPATLALGILIIGLGIYSLFKKELGTIYQPKNLDLKGLIIGNLMIFIIGVMNGSITAGSGLFVTLVTVMWWGMDYKRAVAYTMILVGFFWNLSGAVTLVALGEPLKLEWLITLIIASFLGGYTGSHLGLSKGNTVIKYVFVSVTLLSGFSLLFKVL